MTTKAIRSWTSPTGIPFTDFRMGRVIARVRAPLSNGVERDGLTSKRFGDSGERGQSPPENKRGKSELGQVDVGEPLMGQSPADDGYHFRAGHVINNRSPSFGVGMSIG